MCGMLGQTGGSSGQFSEAFTLLAHRGPDGGGIKHFPALALGHCRLAIIDLSDRSLQPMVDETTGNAIIFNGEIYNYRHLRDSFSPSTVFNTEGDTEVILKGYAKEGIEFFHKLRGMWAFALYDKQKQQVVLSRDYFGIKPLLYSTQGGELAFASEMRAMKKLLTVVSPNTEAYYQFFNLGYFVGQDTCYREVRRLQPGEIVVWDMEKKTTQRTTLPAPAVAPKHGSFDEAVVAVEQALSESVEAHFVADVPVGLLLSGGNDSSLIAALAVKNARKPIAYTLEIEGSIDAPYAERVAAHLNLPHERIPMTKQMFEEGYESAWQVIDEPFADSSIIPTSLIYRAMKGKTKVVLSGEGGDELFGGYTRHLALATLARVSVGGVGDPLFNLYGTSSLAVSTVNPLLSRARRALERASGDLLGAYLSLVRPADFPLATGRLRELLAQQYAARAGEAFATPPSLFFDRALYLPHDLLYKTDMASMASSIEARVPFLDRELFATIASIDPAYCLSPKYTDKLLLKKIAEKYLPHELVYRPKKGFGFSHQRYAIDAFVRDVEQALIFHARHVAEFGLEGERVAKLFAPARATQLIAKYPVFAYALVSNWKVFK